MQSKSGYHITPLFEEGHENPGSASKAQTAYFAAGCFWGVEDQLQKIPGVIDAASGYQGGHTVDPTYHSVCGGKTGHAETVRVTFDPSRVTYAQLLEWFFNRYGVSPTNGAPRTSGRIHTLGELVLAAKRNVDPSDTERSMALLGDPSLTLALPRIAQTRAIELAHANDPPPVVMPPPVSPPMPTVIPGVPAPRASEHQLLTAANQRRLLQGGPSGAPTGATTTAPVPAAAPAAPTEFRGNGGPERNSCSLGSGFTPSNAPQRAAGLMLSLAFATALAKRRVRKKS